MWNTERITMPILEGAGVPPPQQQAFTQWNDPQGTKLIALNRDGTIFCEGVTLDSGATLTFFPNGPVIGATNIPVISQRLQVLNATSPESVSLTVSSTQMVAVSLYLSSSGLSGAGHEVVVTVSYTCELGPETITLTLPLDSRTIMMETYPLLCLAGTTITLSTVYAGGATNDPYNIDARLVQMP
jgi:hypothetical protein